MTYRLLYLALSDGTAIATKLQLAQSYCGQTSLLQLPLHQILYLHLKKYL